MMIGLSLLARDMTYSSTIGTNFTDTEIAEKRQKHSKEYKENHSNKYYLFQGSSREITSSSSMCCRSCTLVEDGRYPRQISFPF